MLAAGWGKKRSIPYDVPANWPAPTYNFEEDPLTKEKIALGRRLFYDPILSYDSTISCSSCHAQYSAFTHVDHNLSHGIYGRIGRRNSPTLFNLAWSGSFMWDGSVAHLTEQARRPICDTNEMDERMDHVTTKLQRSTVYRNLFYNAYQDSTITAEKMMNSIAQFLLTLVSDHSKYDAVMAGRDTFNTMESRGYTLFKKYCASCHAEPLFTNYAYESNGLSVDTELNDNGRYAITHDTKDTLRFKVPSLRNIEFSGPYMHDGRFKTLFQVVNHYIGGVQGNPSVPETLRRGVPLTPDNKVELVAFLLTLSDTAFIRNTVFSYPRNIIQ